MKELKIKEAHKQQIVGFNNSAAPLGFRKDLLELAILARTANDQYLLSFFDGEVPSLEELQAEKAKTVLPVLPTNTTVTETPDAGKDTITNPPGDK
jgi:hypothetical protein